MCNCKKYKPNMLDNREVLSQIREANERILNTGVENLTEEDWVYLYMVYSTAYPNSKGVPTKEDLIKIIANASTLKTAYK